MTPPASNLLPLSVDAGDAESAEHPSVAVVVAVAVVRRGRQQHDERDCENPVEAEKHAVEEEEAAAGSTGKSAASPPAPRAARDDSHLPGGGGGGGDGKHG